MKKIICFVIAIIMLCAIVPCVYATDVVNLDICNGSITIKGLEDGTTTYTQNGESKNIKGELLIRQSDTTVTSNNIVVSSGTATVSIANLNINANTPIIVNDKSILYLTLVGENSLFGINAGVRVAVGGSLIIDGNGKLIATAESEHSDSYHKTGTGGAGIGGSCITGQSNCGNITINSGTIIAYGGNSDYGAGAGIGGGGKGNGGNIIINGGDISAYGGTCGVNSGAGIGGGGRGNGGNITINGGKILAKCGGSGAAGIGGGDSGGNGGNISVNDSNIISYGGEKAAGIGGGRNGQGGCVWIKNSIIDVKNAQYAIGGGGNDCVQYGCDVIQIENSNITSTSNKYYQEKIGNIKISDTGYAALNGNYIYPCVSAKSFSGINYQWQLSVDGNIWTDLDGQVSSCANIKMTDNINECYSRCKLTNVYGNVAYSNSMQLYILSFKNEPKDINASFGETVLFDIVPSCNYVSYQWQKSIDSGISYMDIDGEIYNTIIVNATLSNNGTLYRCVITAENGDSLASNPACLTVSSDAVYYTERYYLQNANNDEYTACEQNSVISTTGANVTIAEKSYDGFAENKSLGKNSGIVLSDSSLLLERYYDRNIYTITFDTNAGVVLPELTAKYGADIQLPIPSRYGYSFDGWYIDSNLTNKENISTMPIDGATLYAKWNSQSSTSRGTEYKINALTLRNASNYEEITSIPTSNFIAEVSVTNLSSTYTDTIIVATYDEKGTLIDLTYMYASIDIGETTALGTLIKNINGDVAKIKVFVWSTLNSLKPLAESVEICK